MPLLFWLPVIVITEMWSMALTETPTLITPPTRLPED
jgi:hypothetical protein